MGVLRKLFKQVFALFMCDKMLKQRLKKLMPHKENRLAVFVDGPNMLRKELGIDLGLIKKEAEKFGSIKIGKVYLNQFASNKLVEAVVNQGFEPIITTTDVDVAMACDATEIVFNEAIDTMVFATRDSDFLPALIKAKNKGKETVAIMGEEMSAAALKNTADKIVILRGKK
jgi:uncharacterized protein (TIGR00288 family)